MKRATSKIILAVIAAIVVCLGGLFVLFGGTGEPTTIAIVHTNDTHGNVSDNEKNTIGFGKLATYVEQLKAENENVLLVDAGDMFQGLPFANLEKGHSVIELANTVGYDAMTVGNHEFDFGADNLFEIASKLNFPMLAANIAKEDGTKVFEAYTVKKMNGVKVGIFGISTEETAFKTHPNNVKGYVFEDMIQRAEETVKVLKKKEKVDVVVMLSHLGLYEGEYTSDLVAQAVAGIDVIVDGHSHTELPEGLMVNDTLIVSTGTALNNVGYVELVVEKGEVTSRVAKLIGYDAFADVVPNAEIEAKIAELTAKQDAALSEVVGKAAVTLEGTRGVVRTSETNLGQLISDSIIDLTGADIALTNGGGIRASIEAGDITLKDIVTVLPFGNTIMVKEIKGEDILAALEHSVSEYPNEKGGFLHIAGMTFTFDASQEVGHRVVEVKVGGQDLDLNATYKVATSDFIAAGGDDYTMFAEYPILAEYNTAMDTLADYIKALGTVTGEFEERIKEVSEVELSAAA